MVPVILDIEASGFGAQSYPIEIGFALETGATHCHLIRPPPHWTHWDGTAEQLHGISREILTTRGKAPLEVALALNGRLAGRTVYSDAWQVDKTWLNQLFDAARMAPAFECRALEFLLKEPQMRVWQRSRREVEAELGINRHRASTDALIIQRTYLRALGRASANV